MRVLRKLVAVAVYAALLLPASERHINAWMRAVEVTSTALDKTLRRRKARLENERFIRDLVVLRMETNQEERTLRRRA